MLFGHGNMVMFSKTMDFGHVLYLGNNISLHFQTPNSSRWYEYGIYQSVS